MPILLDLDGNGLQITELSQSMHFVDATGDGLQNRTAWAGAGDAVLFYDPDGLNDIVETSQYVFTEWDPTAASDIEALRAVFDSNGDGVLDASDAAFADFKLMVTNADGSTSVMTLAAAGITEIDLTGDATHIALPDGSVITGQTTFTRSDGSTGTVGDVTLVADGRSYRVVQSASIDGNGERTETSTGYRADGSIGFVMTSVTSADGTDITNSYDDNGDGVVDRLQTIVTVTSSGAVTETVENYAGSDIVTAVLVSAKATTTSADGSVVTILRDSSGGGWYDQQEVRTTHADDSVTIVVSDLSESGAVLASSSETVSADGQTRTDVVDADGDGDADVTVSETITFDVDGSRTEAVTTSRGNGGSASPISTVTTEYGADGQSKDVFYDLDGDGDTDLREDLDITTTGTASNSTMEVRASNNDLLNSVTQTQSSDALTRTIVADQDGDGNTDLTTVDATVLNVDGSREQTITQTNGDGSTRWMEKTTLGADKVSSETWVDLNRNGTFESTDLVDSVTVDGGTGARTQTVWSRNPDGSINGKVVSVTSADGLSSDTAIDADGDGVTDLQVLDDIVVNGDGSTTRTIAEKDQHGGLEKAQRSSIPAQMA